MGAPIARHLAEAGHELAVFDVRPEAATLFASKPRVRVAASVTDAVHNAEAAFTSLPGPPEVEAVVLDEGGLLASMHPGSVFVDLSTNSPTLVRRLAAQLAEREAVMLDAPVSGGVEGAQAGALSVMVGGDEAVFERMKPVLSTFGSKVYYCGGIGNGSVTKLCNNICSAVNAMIAAEALSLGVRAGVDVKTLVEVIGASTGSSSRLTNRFTRYLLKRNFTPGFSAALSAKDTRLALELAQELDLPMQAGDLAMRELEAVLARGWGELDVDVLGLLQEERAGVELRLE
jgi:3-hydroxyisobutyrate dehydrogenase